MVRGSCHKKRSANNTGPAGGNAHARLGPKVNSTRSSGIGLLYAGESSVQSGDQVAFDSSWACNLEAAEAGTLRSLEFECRVPSNYSGVYGYKARIVRARPTAYRTLEAMAKTWRRIWSGPHHSANSRASP